MQREYKRLACYHAAAILQGAIDGGCLFEVAASWKETSDAEQAVIDGIPDGMTAIIIELERRGGWSRTNQEMVERERRKSKKG